MKMKNIADGDFPPNESRILITDNSSWGFAYVKEKMFRWDGSDEWELFEDEQSTLSWMSLSDLKILLDFK